MEVEETVDFVKYFCEKSTEVGYLALYKISTRNISTYTRETTRNTTVHCVCESE